MAKNYEYSFDDKSYYSEIIKKHQILLVNSNHRLMRYLREWDIKTVDGNKRTTPYTIDLKGTVHKHYDPRFYSDIFGVKEIDSKIIPISLENEGNLMFDAKKKCFINWCGDIYDRSEDVFVKEWRGGLFWAPYTEPQLKATIELINELTNKFDIPKKMLSGFNYEEFSDNFNGILIKTNYSKFNTDINPSLNFKLLKEKIEQYEESK